MIYFPQHYNLGPQAATAAAAAATAAAAAVTSVSCVNLTMSLAMKMQLA
jgi:hypothetical protein